MKTKNNTFLTFLDKMQFSEILCLATYDWFCPDGSHLCIKLAKSIQTHASHDPFYLFCFCLLGGRDQ